MKNQCVKLQNLLFPKTKELDAHWWMFYRGSRLIHDKLDSCYQLDGSESAEFFTYFNAFSLEKWKKYTNIKEVFLRLRVKGSFIVQTFGHYMVGELIKKETIGEYTCDTEKKEEILVPFSMDVRSQVVSFSIIPKGPVSIYGGEYVAMVEESGIRDIHISLVTVTYQKEDFITSNLRLLENEIFYSEEELAYHMDVKVIDNGRTLSEDKWNSPHIHIYPNPNTGGSGGFARGMLESLEDEKRKPTHVLLMDDDVTVLPESFIRTFSLLRLLKEEYWDHFVSGAMLLYEQMNVQHEDVGMLHQTEGVKPRKPRMEMHLWDSVIKNEKIYGDDSTTYAAWWYCCIPVSTMNRNRLPLPIFVRCDDMEYSIANRAKFITLNGICIWHMGFAAKYNAAMDLYQGIKNLFIIQATSGVGPEIDYLKRIQKLFQIELRRFNYIACDLLLDAVDDFMKGPEFLMKLDGAERLKSQTKRCPLMQKVRLEYPNISVNIKEIYVHEEPLNKWRQFWYDRTFNGHLLPKWMLDKQPGIIAHDWFDAPEKQYLKESVLAVCPLHETGILRYRSRREFLRLMRRYRKVVKNYKANGPAVCKRYQDYRQTMTSAEFWKEYLKSFQ